MLEFNKKEEPEKTIKRIKHKLNSHNYRPGDTLPGRDAFWYIFITELRLLFISPLVIAINKANWKKLKELESNKNGDEKELESLRVKTVFSNITYNELWKGVNIKTLEGLNEDRGIIKCFVEQHIGSFNNLKKIINDKVYYYNFQTSTEKCVEKICVWNSNLARMNSVLIFVVDKWYILIFGNTEGISLLKNNDNSSPQLPSNFDKSWHSKKNCKEFFEKLHKGINDLLTNIEISEENNITKKELCPIYHYKKYFEREFNLYPKVNIEMLGFEKEEIIKIFQQKRSKQKRIEKTINYFKKAEALGKFFPEKDSKEKFLEKLQFSLKKEDSLSEKNIIERLEKFLQGKMFSTMFDPRVIWEYFEYTPYFQRLSEYFYLLEKDILRKVNKDDSKEKDKNRISQVVFNIRDSELVNNIYFPSVGFKEKNKEKFFEKKKEFIREIWEWHAELGTTNSPVSYVDLIKIPELLPLFIINDKDVSDNRFKPTKEFYQVLSHEKSEIFNVFFIPVVFTKFFKDDVNIFINAAHRILQDLKWIFADESFSKMNKWFKEYDEKEMSMESLWCNIIELISKDSYGKKFFTKEFNNLLNLAVWSLKILKPEKKIEELIKIKSEGIKNKIKKIYRIFSNDEISIISIYIFAFYSTLSPQGNNFLGQLRELWRKCFDYSFECISEMSKIQMEQKELLKSVIYEEATESFKKAMKFPLIESEEK